MQRLLIDWCLLPEGWAANVGLDIDHGVIAAVTPGAPADGRERLRGIALPGMPNLHCHAFQRGMSGLAERRGPANDNFWTWREVMYRFLERLSPDDVEAIASLAYLEMVERGFTGVVEFHYLHHSPDGAYADPAEMSVRLVAAAQKVGIGMTLLPCFYANGTFGGAPPTAGQRRFITNPDSFAELCESARRHLAALPDAAFGIAPHSLRAVTPQSLAKVLAASPSGPVHIHAAEQTKEVEDCLAWSKLRPVEWLLENCAVDERWCLIHATHTTPAEIVGLVRKGAVVGLCPLTEANLGDGIFRGVDLLQAGGSFGIGTDSQIEINAPGELRQYEYSQRLARRERNVLASGEGASTGRTLYDTALRGGAQASGRPVGRLAVGYRADLVVLDRNHHDVAGRDGDAWLDAYIFTAGPAAIRSVMIGGEPVIQDRRHKLRTEIITAYRRTMARLMHD